MPNSGPDFWQHQRLSQSDLLYLIEKDRVRLVQSQPEERCDIAFLQAAYECNSDAVSGRRKTAALVYSDMVQTDENYLLSQPNLRPFLQVLVKAFAEAHGVPTSEAAKFLLYPKYARRSWLERFHHVGTMGIEPYGQGAIFADGILKSQDKDVRIEAYSFGQKIHMAHALRATYIPHGRGDDFITSWFNPMKLMGEKLNFYRSLNSELANQWQNNETQSVSQGTNILPAIPLFEFTSNASVADIVDFTSFQSTRTKGRSLISRLVHLPLVDRQQEIERLLQELYDFQKPKPAKNLMMDGSTEALSLAIPGVGFGLRLLNQVSSLARKNSKLDSISEKMLEIVSPSTAQKSDLDFLSKVSRVARLDSSDSHFT